MERRGIKRTGATQLIYLGKEFSYENMEVEAQAMVGQKGPDVKVVPAGRYAAVTHIGPYESVRYAHEAMGAWLKQHPEWKVVGPGMERYLKDEGMVSSPEELETGVLFPVERAE